MKIFRSLLALAREHLPALFVHENLREVRRQLQDVLDYVVVQRAENAKLTKQINDLSPHFLYADCLAEDAKKRELAIAEAVRDACIGARYTIPGEEGIDLAAIIATVKD